MTFAAEKFEVATSNSLGEDAFTRKYIIWPWHVTYAPTEFEVTTSKALGGEAFTRKYNIWPLTLTLGSRSH